MAVQSNWGDAFTVKVSPKKQMARCIVRVKTNNYFSGGRMVFTKTVTVLKRQSELSLRDICIEEMEYVDIKNLNEVEDGVYELIGCQFETDGDDWTSWQYAVQWKLIPVDEG